jgi:hypothetical protein
LGPIAVKRFNAPGRIKYAKGTSRVAFGEFKTWKVRPARQPAVMFTAVDYDKNDRGSVAICLYGSMDNFLEYVQAAGPGFRDGWFSSSAPEVYNFIKSHGEQFDAPYFDEADMAIQALLIADGQGLSGIFTGGEHDNAIGFDRPWQRAFTYGDATGAEWLAQIYIDVDLAATDYGRVDGFRRILVGAPLWIRTRSPQAVDLYARSSTPHVVKDRRIRAKWGNRIEENPLRSSADRSLGSTRFAVSEFREEPQVAASNLMDMISVPRSIYAPPRTGFVEAEADYVKREIAEMSAEERILPIGTLFGRVFAWVWNRDHDDAIMMLADFLRQLMGGEVDPPIRLDEVLGDLRSALPRDFSDYDEVVTKARREVRNYLGVDPNA